MKKMPLEEGKKKYPMGRLEKANSIRSGRVMAERGCDCSLKYFRKGVVYATG